MENSLKEKLNSPCIIELGGIGTSALGFITVCEEGKDFPFKIKRTYWTYFTPNNVERGGHAHHNLKQLIISVSGTIKIKVEKLNGEVTNFILDSPDKALYLDDVCWREIKFSHSAVLLCLASENYRESDYIRDYNSFEKLKKNSNAAKQ